MNKDIRETTKLRVAVGLVLLFLVVIVFITVRSIITFKEVGIEEKQAVFEPETLLPKAEEAQELEFLRPEDVREEAPQLKEEEPSQEEEPLEEMELKDLPLDLPEEIPEEAEVEEEVPEQKEPREALEIQPSTKELRELKKKGVIIY